MSNNFENGTVFQRIRKKLEARKGLGKEVVNSVLFGEYTPKRPSDFFVTRMNEINNDLNEKEGVNIDNPYYKALPSINNIIDKNFKINLLDDDISFSQLGFELPKSPSIISKVFNNDGAVRSNIEPSSPQLAASGMNQALTKPFDQLSSIEKEQILFNRA